MPLLCSQCSKAFTSCKPYLTHLRMQHALHYVGSTVRCGQESCPRSFQNFKYLKAHLEKYHSDMFDSVEDDTCYTTNAGNCAPACDEGDTIDMDTDECSPNSGTEMSVNLTASLMNLLGQLQCKSNVTHANIQIVVDCMQGFLEDMAGFCISTVGKMLGSLNIDINVSEAAMCIDEFRALPCILQPISSKYKRVQYFKESGVFVEPVELVLGTRTDSRYVSASGCHAASVVQDTMQYIPLDLLLGTILIDPFYAQAIKQQAAHCKETDAEIVDTFLKSKAYRDNPFFDKHPNGLALNLYVDSFETTNVLGSHTGIHKMEGLYASIQNLPNEMQSKLENIFLVALWYAQDVKTYGYNKILEVIVQMLQRLESDDGMTVCVRGQSIVVRACLVLVSADNLGFNSLFGFCESFTATRFCRFCNCSRDEANCCYTESHLKVRDRQSYDLAVQSTVKPDYDWQMTGIKKGCILNELKYWHVTANNVVDIMHDVLEGVAPFELSLILNGLAKDKSVRLSVETVNSALTFFDYSLGDKNSRPPTLSSFDALRMSATEMWCFLRNLPLLIGHTVPREQEHWLLLQKLLDICDIIFAPAVTMNLCSYLEHLIEEHHVYLKEMLGNDKKLLPKHHFMVHYGTCLRNNGPPVRWWSMRFEARHQTFKDLAKSTHCYKNICKTLASRFQMTLAVRFLNPKLNAAENTFGPSRQVTLSSLGDGLCEVVSKELKMCSQDYVYCTDWISIGHYSFKPNAVTVNSICEGIPQFGIIVNILVIEEKVFFLEEILETVHYDEHFHAYAVKHSTAKQFGLVNIEHLKDHVPLQIHLISYEGSQQLLVALRYSLF